MSRTAAGADVSLKRDGDIAGVYRCGLSGEDEIISEEEQCWVWAPMELRSWTISD